ncbi:hypothetical protein B0H19DRAFT_1236594 [Mycena capillaripes]|nr:hypothetical protein B0H19DRAFT_1236594 [Mycena capillaripes]
MEEILDHLAHDFTSLKACSLVCRAWVSRSRSHLFETCTLVPRNILDFRVRDLLQSFGCTFSSNIRKINVSGFHSSQNNRFFDEITEDLRCLTIRELEVTFSVTAIAIDADWYLRNGFLAAFPHVAHLSLTCNLEVYSQSAMPLVQILCLFPALQTLYIRELTARTAEAPAGAVPPPGLHSLQLSLLSTGPILAWLHTFNHLPNVDSLTLPRLHRQDTEVVRAALQQLGGALRHFDFILTWTPEASEVDSLIVFDLSLHPNLKTLTIRDKSWYTRHGFDPDQMITLITIFFAPDLECLSLHFVPALYRDRVHFDWAALDAFLSPARFPYLRNVVFAYDTDSDELEFLRSVLPSLHASGVLRIGC